MRTNLNVTRRYIEDTPWLADAWPAVRELITNCMDADPTFTKNVTPSTLILTTSTSPTIGQLTAFGEGTKTKGNDTTIGQFGEGFKMAALAITSLFGEGALRIEIPTHIITFSLVSLPGYSAPVLHMSQRARPSPSKNSGCTIIAQIPSVHALTQDKIISDLPPKTCSPLSPSRLTTPTEKTRLYWRGIWVSDLPEPSIFGGWNLWATAINRDRSFVEPYSARFEVSTPLSNLLTTDLCIALLSNPDSFESQTIRWNYSYFAYPPSRVDRHIKLRNAWVSAYHSLYGAKACLSSADKPHHDDLARHLGYTIADVPDPFNQLFRNNDLVCTSTDLIKSHASNERRPLNTDEQLLTSKIASLCERINSPSPPPILYALTTTLDDPDACAGCTVNEPDGTTSIAIAENILASGFASAAATYFVFICSLSTDSELGSVNHAKRLSSIIASLCTLLE